MSSNNPNHPGGGHPPYSHQPPSTNRAFAPTGYPQATPYNMTANVEPPNPYYAGAPDTGSSHGSASHPQPGYGGTLQLPEAGGFSDMGSKIRPVPAATVNLTNAGVRLVHLKHKFNELQSKCASYHGRQAANGEVAVASAIFTGGSSLLLQGPAAIHQRNRLQQIVHAMRECIEQINELHRAFAHTPGWEESECIVQCDRNAFTKAINRQELHGELWSVNACGAVYSVLIVKIAYPFSSCGSWTEVRVGECPCIVLDSQILPCAKYTQRNKIRGHSSSAALTARVSYSIWNASHGLLRLFISSSR